MTTHNCRVCGTTLNIDNWSPSNQKGNHQICKTCNSAKSRLWREQNPEEYRVRFTEQSRKNGFQPFNDNAACSMYLGVHIAERVLSHVFKNVKRMPHCNPGYDFICGRGYKIDVKSSCLRTYAGHSPHWMFTIDKNTTADYFLCLAFDNRKDLNPMHIWLLPGRDFNHLVCTTISTTKISKWDEYKLDISKVSACCDVMRSH